MPVLFTGRSSLINAQYLININFGCFLSITAKNGSDKSDGDKIQWENIKTNKSSCFYIRAAGSFVLELASLWMSTLALFHFISSLSYKSVDVIYNPWKKGSDAFSQSLCNWYESI